MESSELKKSIERIRNESIFRRLKPLPSAKITSLVLGILSHYGWEVFDPYEVAHQYSTSNGKVDIALLESVQNKAFIKIHERSLDLKSNKSLNQMNRYFKDESGFELGVLTNAISWVFLKRSPNSADKIIKVAEIDVKNDLDSKIEQIFNDYLSKK